MGDTVVILHLFYFCLGHGGCTISVFLLALTVPDGLQQQAMHTFVAYGQVFSMKGRIVALREENTLEYRAFRDVVTLERWA